MDILLPTRLEIVNGPNLHRIGLREPELYGRLSFDHYLGYLRDQYPKLQLEYFQNNHEGALIDYLYQAHDAGSTGIVLNAGAYTHSSIALLDAIRAIDTPVVEVHISNIYAREPYRHQSMLASACIGQISGFGLDSYRLAIEALLSYKSLR